MMKTRTCILLLLTLLMTACTDHEKHGSLTLCVSHEVDDQVLVTDTLCYTTEAGNRFLVTEIQWFLSDLELCDTQGRWVTLGDVFYFDTNLPERQVIRFEAVPATTYRTLRFTFGMNDADNLTGRFSNPPERDMFWPEPLGGGYHYMKLNGKYLDGDGHLAPMNIHLGRGQNADLTEFYDNSFSVEIPVELTVTENGDNPLNLVMTVNNWFREPNLYDINAFGSAIMQNQDAQQALKENGHNVFSIKTNHDMESPFKTPAALLQKAAPKPHFMTWKNIKKTLSEIKEKL